jgi:hypothetical protein
MILVVSLIVSSIQTHPSSRNETMKRKKEIAKKKKKEKTIHACISTFGYKLRDNDQTHHKKDANKA